MAEPQSLPKIDRLHQLTTAGSACWPAGEILEYIRKYASGNTDVDSFLASLAESEVQVVERESVDEGPATDLDKMIEGSPIINLVNVALLTAIRDGASDIHIEPDKHGTRIRYRIDGLLRDLMKPPPGLHASIASREVIGRMDIAERLPQGRVQLSPRDAISTCASRACPPCWVKIVIRILDKANLHPPGGARLSPADVPGLRENAQPALRDGPGDRPDRQRQDHDLVLRPRPDSQPGPEPGDGGGPRRIPARHGEPDSGS
jgi:type II secretory ATPase GspE/PulE/Tfp pilus assembly ATPase PilB-like protein